MNTVQYTLTDPDKLETAVTKLRAYAKTALQNGETTTPLSAAERFSVVQNSTDPTVEALDQIAMRLDELETLFRGEGPDPADYLEALLREERKEKRDIRRQLEEVMLRLTAALGEPPFGPEVISDPEERERQIAAFRGAGLFGEPSGTEVQQTTSKPST